MPGIKIPRYNRQVQSQVGPRQDLGIRRVGPDTFDTGDNASAAAQIVQRAQDRTDKALKNSAVNKSKSEMHEFLWNKDSGLMYQNGENVLGIEDKTKNAFTRFKTEVMPKIEQIKAKLPEHLQGAFDAAIGDSQRGVQSQIGRKFNSENTEFENEQLQGMIQNSQSDMILNLNDPMALPKALAEIGADVRQNAEENGMSKEATNYAVKESESSIITARLGAKLASNTHYQSVPAELERYKGRMTDDDYLAIKRATGTKIEAVYAKELAETAYAKYRGDYKKALAYIGRKSKGKDPGVFTDATSIFNKLSNAEDSLKDNQQEENFRTLYNAASAGKNVFDTNPGEVASLKPSQIATLRKVISGVDKTTDLEKFGDYTTKRQLAPHELREMSLAKFDKEYLAHFSKQDRDKAMADFSKGFPPLYKGTVPDSFKQTIQRFLIDNGHWNTKATSKSAKARNIEVLNRTISAFGKKVHEAEEGGPPLTFEKKQKILEELEREVLIMGANKFFKWLGMTEDKVVTKFAAKKDQVKKSISQKDYDTIPESQKQAYSRQANIVASKYEKKIPPSDLWLLGRYKKEGFQDEALDLLRKHGFSTEEALNIYGAKVQ